MKIVVLDGYTLNPGDLSWDGLKEFGELTVNDRVGFDPDIVVEAIGDAEIIFTNKTPLSRSVLDRVPSVRYIGVLATGYNVVDTVAARESGIKVTNIPTYGTTAVAQHTFALLLEMCHQVGAHSEAVKKGEWTSNPDFCFWNSPLIELAGKTMGFIGFGRIGQATARIAKSFGLNILAHDTYEDPALEGDACKYVTLEELLADSDIITLHCPLTESNTGIINKETISAMKDGIMIINTARGPLVVEQDLCDALNSGKVAGAAVDVVSKEPISADNPLLGARNCIITPHIAWAPKEARIRLMDIAINNLSAFLSGKPVNVVNN